MTHPERDDDDGRIDTRYECPSCHALWGAHYPACWAQRAQRASDEARAERERNQEQKQ